MGVIKQLPDKEAQKIAAGEVVDRPANIVKELIENSLDAASTTISVFIEDGGKKLIRVDDNGHGMARDDARRSILRHCTSKIGQIEDLDNLITYGFRGEALASISAVTKMQLITKESNAQEGTKFFIDAGTITQEEPCAWSQGTRITLEDLFFNVPARKKFLRATSTETRAICQLFQALALAHPQHKFSLYSENKLVYNCGVTKTPAHRFKQLSNTTLDNSLLPVASIEQQGIKLSGFISHHHVARYDRNHIFFFVNNRWIKHYKLTSALLRGYQNVLPQRKYPIAGIFLEINPNEVDVNIHPRKEEVAFLHPNRVENLVAQAVKKTLEAAITKTAISYKQEEQNSHHIKQPEISLFQNHLPPFNTWQNRAESNHIAPQTFSVFPPLEQPPVSDKNENMQTSHESKDSNFSPLQPENESFITAQRPYRLLGQFARTYILIEHDKQLIIVDGHAAHERILYEEFGSKFKNKESVGLLFPPIIELAQEDIETILVHKKVLDDVGIILESFGPNKLMINATPAGLQDINYQEFIKQIVSIAGEQESLSKEHAQDLLAEKLRALMACKAAVKAGDELNTDQMYRLLDDLFHTKNRLTCPHGRPTTWPIDQYEIEKKFKRRL